MRLSPLGLLAAGLLTPLAAFAAPQPPAAPPAQTAVRLAWDEFYLFAAFTVPDNDVVGTSRTAMSQPERDDSVGLYLKIGEKTQAMLVSAAGGFTFLENGQPRPLFSIKYGVAVQGTLNRSDDKDTGYTVELAIPWAALGIDGAALDPAKTALSVALAVRQRGNPLPALYPATASLTDPTTWQTLRLAAGEGLVAPRLTKAPLIDGVLTPTEWPDTAPIAFAAPETPAVTIDVAQTPFSIDLGDPETAPRLSASPWTGTPRQVLARYVATFQADITKALPNRGIFTPTGTIALVDQPALGIGPWFSSDRVGWHRGELTALRRAGIETALVQVGGPDAPAGPLDEKSMLVLAAALREMAQERVPVPKIGLWLDTLSLGGKPDLATETGRATLSRAIERMLSLVPAEYRARLPLPPTAGAPGLVGVPVVLSDADGLTGIESAGWVDALQKRFAGAFGPGASLVLLGGKGFDDKPGLAGVLPLFGSAAGALPTAVVRPGSQIPLVPRKNGETYRQSWETALGGGAAWIVLDSWNDFLQATEIAPSRQYGDLYVDATRIQTVRALAVRERGVRLTDSDLPRTVRTGQVLPAVVHLQNVGLQPLAPGDARLTYRLLQGETTIAEGPVAIRLGEGLLPTQTAAVRLGIATVGPDARPLAPGVYTLRVTASLGDEPIAAVLSVPVTVADADAPGRVQIAGTSVSPLLMAGGAYGVQVRLRWLGSEPLAPGDARLAYQFVTLDGKNVVAAGSVPVETPLNPGAWVSIPALLPVSVADGSPLPAAAPEARAQTNDDNRLAYRLRWTVIRPGESAPTPGAYEELVAVYPGDDEVRLVPPAGVPDILDAGKQIRVTLTVINRGPFRWGRGAYALAYRWCYADGFTSRQVDGERIKQPIADAVVPVPIDREVAPGESVAVTIPLRAPDREGRYIAQFTVVRAPGGFLDGASVTRTGDIAMVPVTVHGGRLTTLDLSPLFNVDTIATEAAPGDGDMDSGASLPAEWMPPDAFGVNRPPRTDPKKRPETVAYPSGYFSEITSEAARLVSFRYGSSATGAKNAIACAGQTVPVPKDRYPTLHLAAAATGGEARPLTLTLRYADNTTETWAHSVGDWRRVPDPATEAIAISVPRVRTADADTGVPAFVRHLVVPLNPAKSLVGITLGDDPKLKIFALTLEK
jgi:hypothetical protein